MDPMMTRTESALTAANRALGRRFFEEQDRIRGGPAEALCAADYRAFLGGNVGVDRPGHEAFARAFYTAFPDIRHHIEEVIATESGAVVRFVLQGTHTGSFFGIPPTSRPVVVVANVLMDVVQGKVTKLRGVFDEAGLLRQIGVLAG
jgi:predicted ester cyclase